MFHAFLCLGLAALTAASVRPRAPSLNQLPRMQPFKNTFIPINGSSTFQQLLDHGNPALGTFSQRFWWNDEFWAGPGSPVVLFTPGEDSADDYTGYLTNRTLTGAFAEAIRGAVILIEHRYWGNSSPFAYLTTKNLQYLTLRNAIADLSHFAKTAALPFDPTNKSSATFAPWVLAGSSYSGALSAWTESTAPGTFWAYQASSAPVEAIYNYWQYLAPVQEGMARNCSKDVSLVIDHVDNVLTYGTTANKLALKRMFGLGSLEHDDDFASALSAGLFSWQDIYPDTGYSSFFQFCDFVENVAVAGNFSGIHVTPGVNGVGLQKALKGYARWMKNVFVPGNCASSGSWSGEYNVACLNTYNASSPIYTDISVGNLYNRQWQWLLCNEPFAWYPDGAPEGTQTIVSRLVVAEYWQRQCSLFFPTEGTYTYGSARGLTVDKVNANTKGWNLEKTTRLMWINGQYDPWREAGVSSDFRPGGPLLSTAQAPVLIVPGGGHGTEMIMRWGAINADVQNIVDKEIAQMRTWVSDYYEQKFSPQIGAI